MAKILQYLQALKMYHSRHAEHSAKNRTSLCGLDQKTLFGLTPYFGKKSKAYTSSKCFGIKSASEMIKNTQLELNVTAKKLC